MNYKFKKKITTSLQFKKEKNMRSGDFKKFVRNIQERGCKIWNAVSECITFLNIYKTFILRLLLLI